MRIVYKDISTEFAALMQEAMANRSAITCINVTRQELQMLFAHTSANLFFSDYLGPRNAKVQRIDRDLNALAQKLERVTTQVERQQVFNERSDLETERAKLTDDVPSDFMQNGIRIKVAMKA